MSEPPVAPDPSSSPDPARRRALFVGLVGGLLALAMIAVGAVLWLTTGAEGPLRIGGPFALVDGDGHAVTDRDFRGKYMLVYFGYTFCPDVCPTTLNQIADALDRLGPLGQRIVPVFITIDPRRDTPEAVKDYAAAFSPRLVGLTGSAEQIGQVARAYRVYYAERRTGPGPNDYAMDHSSILYLMGPDGGFVGPIRAEASGEEMAADLRRLMK